MRLDGQVVVEHVFHPSLAGNLLGDPPDREIPVYLPPGYDPARRYPVVYYLVGYTGQALSPLNVSAFEPNLVQRFDRLVSSGAIRPSLLVLPDGFTKLGGSQYINSALNGRYEDAIAGDLVEWVDRRFSTVDSAAGRAIAGKSSGGYGALMFGMRHPDRFGIVVSHSGDMAFEQCYRPDFLKVARAIEERGGPAGFLDWFFGPDRRGGSGIDALNVIAMAAAYSPNPSGSGGVDLPFDLHTVEIVEAVWQRWQEHDPIRLAGRHVEALRGLRLLFFDAGLKDEYHLQYGARILARRLDELGISYVHEEFDDGHMNVTYRVERSLRLISEAFGVT